MVRLFLRTWDGGSVRKYSRGRGPRRSWWTLRPVRVQLVRLVENDQSQVCDGHVFAAETAPLPSHGTVSARARGFESGSSPKEAFETARWAFRQAPRRGTQSGREAFDC
jgi:hypothetical protein